MPNQFLDDFYKIFNHTTIHDNEINIDLDIVIKWLSITKYGAKNTLLKSYKKDTDYTIKKILSKKALVDIIKKNLYISRLF